MNKFSLLLLYLLILSCKKVEDCPEYIDLGVVKLTKQSENYIPCNYSDTLAEIEFISSIGEIKVFKPTKPLKLIGGGASFFQYCEKVPFDSTRVSFKYEDNSYHLYSNDSLVFSIIQKTDHTNSAYYDVISIAFSDVIQSKSLGQIFTITDLRDYDISQTYIPIGNTFYSEKVIAGVTFHDVWGEDSHLLVSDVFYNKDLGFVGFIDAQGKEWRLK